jgi:D-alanine transaminase
MSDGLAGLRIPFGPERVAALRGIGEDLLAVNDLLTGDAFLYLQVTRGAAPRTHAFPPPSTPPTVFASATRLAPNRDQRHHGVAAITHEDLRWARCDWKTVNLLGSVLARQAAAEAGAFDAILVRDGVITEGAATTVFAVVDGVVRTHPLGHRILPSITRKVVLACIAERAVPLRELPITEPELRRADEIFLCGSTTDVTPVVRLDGVPVGAGTPGPITAQLREALDRRLYRKHG